MDCQFLEKISALIDGELPSEEIESVRAHLVNCDNCRTAEQDFLFLKREIKYFTYQTAPAGESSTQSANLENRFRLNGKVSLPIPVFGIFLLILAGVIGWLIWSGLERKQEIVTDKAAESFSVTEMNRQKISKEASLAKFDGGGRAEIYVVSNRGSADADE